MKSTHAIFGITFYAVIGWSHAYMYNLQDMQDSGLGNKTDFTPVQRYTKVFRSRLGTVKQKVDGEFILKAKHSALWCTRIAHQNSFPSQARSWKNHGDGQVLHCTNSHTKADRTER